MSSSTTNISNKPSPHSGSQRAARVLWGVVYAILYRPSPRPLYGWRIRLLRMFGAKVSARARPCPKARIWAPWNLTLHEFATLADDVDCYCVAPISIGAHTTVSQYSYLCAASHDFEHPRFPLVPAPITIGSGCWLAADVFVAPGVTIGDNTVVGARSSVFADLPPAMVCVGAPARAVRARVMRDTATEGAVPTLPPDPRA